MLFENGAVLPSSLFTQDTSSGSSAFEKTYSNTSLRVGIVKKTIAADSPQSVSKEYPEYDVLVYEQNTNLGGTPTVYKNCLVAQGFGSIADFFEYTVRSQTPPKNGANGIDAYDQDGALALVLCINGYGDRGIIVSFLNHPNRPTTIVGKEKHLEGEFNGVNIKVTDDGSAVLSFKGATDNWGKPIDKEQGTTTVSIEKDGSVQIQNKGVTQRLEKTGNVSITNIGNLSTTSEKDISISGNKGGVSLTSKADNLIAAAKGDLTLDIKNAINVKGTTGSIKLSSSLNLEAQQIEIKAQALATIKAPQMVLDGLVFLGGQGGLPLPTVVTQYLGSSVVGPVLSVGVGPFTTKVFAT